MQLGLSLMAPLRVVMKSHVFFSLLGVSSGNFTSLGGRLCRMKRRDASATAEVVLVVPGSRSLSHPDWSVGDNPHAVLPSV